MSNSENTANISLLFCSLLQISCALISVVNFSSLKESRQDLGSLDKKSNFTFPGKNHDKRTEQSLKISLNILMAASNHLVTSN